jgi:DNA polymerase V
MTGGAIARSNEAKALGIQMGEPAFQIRNLIKSHGIQVYSSITLLYGDMSQRVMQTISQFTPDIESIPSMKPFWICPVSGIMI